MHHPDFEIKCLGLRTSPLNETSKKFLVFLAVTMLIDRRSFLTFHSGDVSGCLRTERKWFEMGKHRGVRFDCELSFDAELAEDEDTSGPDVTTTLWFSIETGRLTTSSDTVLTFPDDLYLERTIGIATSPN